MWLHLIPEKFVRVLYTLLLLAGVLIIGWSVLVMRSTTPEESYFHTTSGTVRSVQPAGAGQFEVRAEFSLDGENAIYAKGFVDSSHPVREGDRLLVHFNPYSPQEVQLQVPPRIRAEFLIFFGILIGGLGFRFFIRTIFADAKQRFIRENGRKVTPHTSVLENVTIKLLWIVKIPAIRIHCTWQRDSTSEELNFYSDPFPISKEHQLQMDNVKVYFIPQAPNRYFVEV